MIFMIDNYDSFTYNLVQMIQVLGRKVEVKRNNKIDVKTIEDLDPEALVISPGPGNPSQAGVSIEAIKQLGPNIPTLGVCLGHQSIGTAFGAEIIGADRIMHGKSSEIHHDNRTIFEGLPNPFDAIRYHSLIVNRESLPDCFQVSAWTDTGEIMGLRHKEYNIEAVQFHPESILTFSGVDMMKNFLGGYK